jgi:hypothetical protein
LSQRASSTPEAIYIDPTTVSIDISKTLRDFRH